eukprot:TRINITY_DN299_c0_g1_i1.p1 TRINITY_DN299_c0_g1~~TRINITY_DN299_c0_g1_i1.p1  ORF type:complete len:433 (-),score=72.35 TRINITY_DN299_c0_g1_i1:160-1458(-)
MKFTPREESFVTKLRLLDRLEEMTQKGSSSDTGAEGLLNEFTILVKQLFALTCMQFPNSDVARFVDMLPVRICNGVIKELEQRLQALTASYDLLHGSVENEIAEMEDDEFGADPRFSENVVAKQLHSVEDLVYTNLILFRQLLSRTSLKLEQTIVSPEVLGMFLAFLNKGSPRIQRICLLMLGDFCPDINLLSRTKILSVSNFLGEPAAPSPKREPEEKKQKPEPPKGGLLGMLDDMAEKVPAEISSKTQPSELLDKICGMIGVLLTAPKGMEKVHLNSPFSYIWSAESRRNLAMEYISFLRRLYLEESNVDMMNQYFRKTLMKSADIIDPKSSTLMVSTEDDLFLKCMGVLSVLGGAPDRMHHGCSIHSKSEGDDSNNAKEAGTCIDYNNLSASVLVKFDNVKRPVSMKKSKVQASCKIGVPKDFMLTDDL